MNLKIILVLLFFIAISGCGPIEKGSREQIEDRSPDLSKIQVLNFATFHFGYTSDAHSVDFDEKNKEIQEEVKAISKMIAAFKPTIICVEALPEDHDELNTLYQKFLKDTSTLITELGETSMVAFDVARLNDIDSIYGIDNHMGYNYSVGDFIEDSPDLKNSVDPATYLQLTNEPFKANPEMAKRYQNFDSLSLLNKLRFMNEAAYLDHSISTNADKLLYVGIGDEFQGADNAAIFYNRNMRIYSNLNRIPMNKNDRVFILMGAAHTAFLREFMGRSPKFEMVNTLKYIER